MTAYYDLKKCIKVSNVFTLTCIEIENYLIMERIMAGLAFFQDFLAHFAMKVSKSSITQGRGTIF